MKTLTRLLVWPIMPATMVTQPETVGNPEKPSVFTQSATMGKCQPRDNVRTGRL